MATFIILGIIVALIVGGIVGLVNSEDRYSKMTEEEFDAEAKRSSAMGAALVGLQKVLEPSRKVEFIRQKKVEADRTDIGDTPEAGAPK